MESAIEGKSPTKPISTKKLPLKASGFFDYSSGKHSFSYIQSTSQNQA